MSRTLTFLCLALAATSTASADIFTGLDAGALPHVKGFTNGPVPVETLSFNAYPTAYTGGVRVAVGDVNGDSTPDVITGAAVNGHVKVFDGTTGAEVRSFLAYGANFTGGVFVGGGRVDNDAFADIVTGTDAGVAPHVKVFSGATNAELASFFAYTPSFIGGVRVAAGDVTGDGRADIITGTGPGANGHVKVFDGVTNAEVRSFFAYGAGFSGGVFVGSGDVNNDGLADIVTGVDAGVLSHVKVFSGATGLELHSFFAYGPSFTGGVRVAAGDVTGDGRADIITGAGPGVAGHVKVFDGVTGQEVRSFFAYGTGAPLGVFVGAGNRIPEPSAWALGLLAAAGCRGRGARCRRAPVQLQ